MAQGPEDTITRRAAIGATLLGIGGLCGWAVHRLRGGPARLPEGGSTSANRHAYDLSEFERTDPKTLLFEPAGEFDPGFAKVRRIATTPAGELMVTGDKEIRIFDTSGRALRAISLDHTPHCTHVSQAGELFVGYARHFDVHDSGGTLLHSTERFSERSFLTAIATSGDAVYVADAGNREVIGCDRRGAVERRFGKIGEATETPGFEVPSPYFDLAVDAHGKLRVANPGQLRVETYSAEGRFEASWGEPGMGIDRFAGCGNPVFFTLTGDGGFITSEKGLARVKLHDPRGKVLGLVAGPDFLVQDKKLAKRAGRAAGGFDIALDDQGRVHVLDPYRGVVRSFRPLS